MRLVARMLLVGLVVAGVACDSESPPVVPILAVAGPLATIRIDDTVRFTALGQRRPTHLAAFDAKGVRIDNPKIHWTFSPAVIATDSTGILGVETPTLVSGKTGVAIAGVSSADRPDIVLATTTIIVEQVVEHLSIYGIDTATGIAVGESKRIDVLGFDSLGSQLPNADLAAKGLKIAVSDPSVGTMSDSVLITGLTPGRTTVTATIPGRIVALPFTVMPRIELGARRILRTNPIAGQPVATHLVAWGDDASYCGFEGGGFVHGPPAPVMLACYGPDGLPRFSRLYTGDVSRTRVKIDATGSVYLADNSRLTAIAIDGSTRWMYDGQLGAEIIPQFYPPEPIVKGRVVMYAVNTRIVAMSLDGTLAWTQALDAHVNTLTASASRVYAFTDSTAFAFDLNGAKLWEAHAPRGDGRVDADENLVVALSPATGSHSGSLIGFDAAGRERWRQEVAAEPSNGFSIELGPNGSVLAFANGSRIGLFDPFGTITSFDRVTGARRWSVVPPTYRGETLATTDGRLIIATDYFWTLDAATGRFLGRNADPIMNSNARLLPGALVVAGTYHIMRYDVPFGPTP